MDDPTLEATTILSVLIHFLRVRLRAKTSSREMKTLMQMQQINTQINNTKMLTIQNELFKYFIIIS